MNFTRSPGTEEVAVFHAFARIVNQARPSVVVHDTAPTGHTLLPLDATGAYHREVMRTTTVPADRIVTPMMRLRDPEYTRILIVTLPETTPVLEAARLQEDLPAELRLSGCKRSGRLDRNSCVHSSQATRRALRRPKPVARFDG